MAARIAMLNLVMEEYVRVWAEAEHEPTKIEMSAAARASLRDDIATVLSCPPGNIVVDRIFGMEVRRTKKITDQKVIYFEIFGN